MRKHEEMLASGKASVWIGNIPSEDELLVYVDDGCFGRDFDFEVNPRFGREIKAEQQPVSIEKLVEGFSSWRSFVDECVRQARGFGITSAKCMVVFYAFHYSPSDKTNLKSQLKFIGVFDFE